MIALSHMLYETLLYVRHVWGIFMIMCIGRSDELIYGTFIYIALTKHLAFLF